MHTTLDVFFTLKYLYLISLPIGIKKNGNDIYFATDIHYSVESIRIKNQ